MKNEDEMMQSELARTLLVLNNYDWLKTIASKIGVEIIPLKGIDLLQNLYAETLERHLNDIDVLCKNERDCMKLINHLCQEDYRVEFSFAIQPEALASKRKVSLLSCCPIKLNIDIHTSFVTKKFFSRTIGTFNEDALERCENGYMDNLDRWLYLAQHATFHVFSDCKWVKDLELLYDRFSEKEKSELGKRINDYGFRRIVIATLYQIAKNKSGREYYEFNKLRLSSSERRFLTFIKYFDRPFSRNVLDRLVLAYWEFVFIQSKAMRQSAWLQLIFPSKGLLTNIYRIKKEANIVIYYPLNFVISVMSSAFFCVLYAFICIKHKCK